MILACAARYPIPTTGHELKSAEIACVAGAIPAYRKSNRGRQILDYLKEDKAKAMGIQQLFI